MDYVLEIEKWLLNRWCTTTIFSNSALISVSGEKSSKLKYIVVSSAYIINLSLLLTFFKSFTTMLNSKGSRFDPCGTPLVISVTLDL